MILFKLHRLFVEKCDTSQIIQKYKTQITKISINTHSNWLTNYQFIPQNSKQPR